MCTLAQQHTYRHTHTHKHTHAHTYTHTPRHTPRHTHIHTHTLTHTRMQVVLFVSTRGEPHACKASPGQTVFQIITSGISPWLGESFITKSCFIQRTLQTARPVTCVFVVRLCACVCVCVCLCPFSCFSPSLPIVPIVPSQSTATFELYAVFDSLATKQTITRSVLELLRWLKKSESRLFMLSPQLT